MKQLSIEQKAKRYDEALHKAKSVIEQNPLMEYLKKGIEYIFPELKESEDERIRQLLIRFVKYDMPDNYSDDFSKEDCLDWLEKQDEQILANSAKTCKDEQKTAWSEEDEELMKWSINNLTELKNRFGEEYGKVGDCINWLKSLKDRYTWKPTKEQMRALTFACIKNVDIDKSSIKALYDLKEQLKQL